MNDLDYAQYAFNNGPGASERPPYNSSHNGMAFSVGLWARGEGIVPQEVRASRGYNWILNRQYKLNFKDSDGNPKVSLV